MTKEEIAIGLAKDSEFKKLTPDRQQAVFNEAVRRAGSSDMFQSQSVTGASLPLTPSQPIQSQGFHPIATNPLWQTFVTRPNAMYRSAVRGLLPGASETPQQGFLNAATAQGSDLINRAGSVAPIQKNMIDAYYQNIAQHQPGQYPTIPQVLAGFVPSAVGLGAETLANIATGPADAIAALAPFTRAGQMAGTAIAESPAGQAVGRFMTQERHLPNPIEFLRGNPNKIQEANKALETTAHEFVKDFRAGGTLHGKVFETLHNESTKAWAPMKQVTASIQDTIGINDVRQALADALPNNPERLAAANLFLDNMAESSPYTMPKSGRAFGFTASDWSDLSSEIGGFMRKAALRGQAARTFTDQIHSDLRTAIANIIESKAPSELQGNVALAKQQWANYAADRDRLFQIFAPGGSPNLPTKTGVNFVREAATNQLPIGDQEFLGRLQETSGIKLPPEIMKHAKALTRVRASGTLGKTIAQTLPYLTAAEIAHEALRRR